jgi:hypothetical protein
MPCEGEALDRFTSEQLSDLLEEHLRAVLRSVHDAAEPATHAWDRAEDIWREFRRRHQGSG